MNATFFAVTTESKSVFEIAIICLEKMLCLTADRDI